MNFFARLKLFSNHFKPWTLKSTGLAVAFISVGLVFSIPLNMLAAIPILTGGMGFSLIASAVAGMMIGIIIAFVMGFKLLRPSRTSQTG